MPFPALRTRAQGAGSTANVTEGIIARSKENNLIFIPDLRKFSNKVFGNEIMDFPIILHEIGHIKHYKVEKEAFVEQKNIAMRVISNLATVGIDRTELEYKNGTLFEKLSHYIDAHAPQLIKTEEIASSWACKWIEEKKAEGFDIWESDDDHYWQQLDRALATYKNFWTIDNEAWSYKSDEAGTYLEQWIKYMKEKYPHIVIENISKKKAETPVTISEKNEDITNFWNED